MSDFTVSCDLDTALALTSSKMIRADVMKAKQQAMIYYVEELLMEHFNMRSPNMKYPPNTLKYEEWKRKHRPDALYQLVLGGKLRSAVERATVDSKTGKVSVSVPEYGIFQMKVYKRDFLTPDLSDQLKIHDRLRKNFFFLRSIRAKKYSGT